MKLLQEIELVAEGTFTDKFETHGKLTELTSLLWTACNWKVSQICPHRSDLALKMFSFSRNT